MVMEGMASTKDEQKRRNVEVFLSPQKIRANLIDSGSRNFAFSTNKQVNKTDKDNLIRQRLPLRFKAY
jgi:hypothetical protein